MFQDRSRLTERMYLSMNSRYTIFVAVSSLQGNRSAHVLIAQPQLNAKMRAILVVWLVNFRSELQVPPLDSVMTLCLIDQYLDRRPVPRRQLQLVGVAAMLIAAKFEEICPPEV